MVKKVKQIIQERYGAMNVQFWKKNQDTTLEEAKELVAKSHKDVMELEKLCKIKYE